jgi:hypothetical protein
VLNFLNVPLSNKLLKLTIYNAEILVLKCSKRMFLKIEGLPQCLAQMIVLVIFNLRVVLELESVARTPSSMIKQSRSQNTINILRKFETFTFRNL